MSYIGDIYFWRQTTVLICSCMQSIGVGLMLSFPAVLNPAILSPDSDGIHATADQASWIASSLGISGLIGCCLIPYLMQTFGRKCIYIALNIFVGLGFLIFALANSVPVLYVARVTQGLSKCGVYIASIIIGEYSDPKRRGYFITVKKCASAIGALICHSLGLCWTWKQIAIFGVVPPSVAIIMTFLWPESPAFLALNGRYDECENSHAWLYGNSPRYKKDLEELIATQTERRQLAKNNRTLKTVIKSMLKKDFVKPFIIVSLLTMIVDACGRYYMLAYVIQILMEIMKDKSLAIYCTIGAVGLTLIALILSCFVIKCFKRRTLLLTSGIISVTLMFLVSVIIFFKSRYIFLESVYWLTPSVILLNVFVVNLGVVPTCFAIISEIFPLEHKGTGSCAISIVFTILYALVMKFTPLMIEKTGVEGTFGIYGLFMFVGLLILYFILNETKDKTLQEIENEIKGVKRSNDKEKPLIST